MKHVYKIQDLCCASCSGKIEKALKKMPDIQSPVVNVMTQKLSFDSELAEAELDPLLEDIQRIITKYEPECRLITGQERSSYGNA